MVIASYKTTLSLENNRRHLFEWTRDKNGVMSVVLDGQEVMRVTDKTITKPFDGLLFVNGGGSYYIRSVSVDGLKPQRRRVQARIDVSPPQGGGHAASAFSGCCE